MDDANGPIALPKGGGAIKGIGETFQPNLFSGTGNFSIPIYTSPGRAGFGPELSLQYSTGNGNGPFGMGWQLSLPRITRKTEKGLPLYTDDDVFVMSGAEDLVPFLRRSGQNPDAWEPHVTTLEPYTITRYRPRTEGLFARIEKWTAKDGDVHWRATTKSNVTSIYGRSSTARIAHPEHSDKVFEWLLEESFDARGNHILYEYIQEDPTLELEGLHERNRSYTQAYIRRILYGNSPDGLADAKKCGPERVATDHAHPLLTRQRHYHFEVLFDYGDITGIPGIPHEPSLLKEDVIPASWSGTEREDAFSSFRSGFEIRTLRRCHRVFMLHHFREGEVEQAPLVKSTDFSYDDDPGTELSFLAEAKLAGYRKDPANPSQYLTRDMPPVSFGYSKFEPDNQHYQSIDAQNGDFPPLSLGAPNFSLLDVYGNGLPDVLQADASGYYFWENRGEGKLSGRRPQPGNVPAVFPAQANVATGDMGGDGLADLVVDAPSISGFYESSPEGGWRTFRQFQAMPSFSLADPDTRLVDLTGDGLSDVLVTRDAYFLWYRCIGEKGYADPQMIPRKFDLDEFPNVYFSDPAGRVRLADMSGDGLSDIVLVHDGRIDYWPNLGYGKFGKRLTLAKAPSIGFGFDPRRLFLVDLDGTGTADLVYVEHNRVRFWLNQSGNGFSDELTIDGTPFVTNQTSVQFTDFFGTGTTALLWSYDYGTQPGAGNYKALDFCGGRKPHLLVAMSNNMGATTKVQYASSTRFYLEDKANGMPWHSSPPFPVQVLEKSEVIDHLSRTKLVSTYKYHHGYYDGHEREFRGFGRVDQFDTEYFEEFEAAGLHGQDADFDNRQAGFHLPPVETRTWFHSGVYFDPNRRTDHRELVERFREEYYDGDDAAFVLGSTLFTQPDGSPGPGDTPHEAFRALRGAELRKEVYGPDGSALEDHPYSVTDNRYRVAAVQPAEQGRHPVYLLTTAENISYHYERNPTDPRISHSITAGIDGFGNVTDSLSIGYPRRNPPADKPEQAVTSVVYARADYINRELPQSNADAGYYFGGILCQSRSYEITGLDWHQGQTQLSAEDFRALMDTSIDVDTTSFKPYEWERDPADTGLQRRLIEWSRSFFRANANPEQIDPVGSLAHRLPLGEIESLALPYESYQAAFTAGHLQQVYGTRLAGVDMAEEGGYHPHQNHPDAEGGGEIAEYWWVPSGRAGFDPVQFFHPVGSQDPFGHHSSVQLDVYALLPESTRDALPAPLTNMVIAKNDYRTLQPAEITDPNGNRSAVAFDALGLVVGTAVSSQDSFGEPLGDSLDGFVADLDEQGVRDPHIADPLGNDAHNILCGASTRLVYDLHRFRLQGEPNVVYQLARETHVSDEQGVPSRIQHGFTYSDGFGRELQTKAQAEPDNATPTKPRWVGTGTIVYNNKGEAVQQYEPFFSDHHRQGIEQHGVSSTIFYDSLARQVCTVHPDHSYEKVLFDPWQQAAWDRNDTVLLDPRTDPDVIHVVERYFAAFDLAYIDENGVPPETWYQSRIQESGSPRQAAAKKTEAHANTPSITHLDALSRAFLTVADNGLDENGNQQRYETRVIFDIEGNQLAVIDALGRTVMRYHYGIAGPGEDGEASNPLHQSSMDAGERWLLNNVAGSPIRSWDSRAQQFRIEYDALLRPTHKYVKEAQDPEQLLERLVYGESHDDATELNLRGQLFRHYDGAGAVTNVEFDFKGGLLCGERRLAREYKAVVDWIALAAESNIPAAAALAEPQLEDEVFRTSTSYDALGRATRITTPDGAVIFPGYNEANLLDCVEAELRDEHSRRQFVSNIDYDARGLRQRVDYGNGAHTTYRYEPETLRLSRLRAFREADNVRLQDLSYTYDPVGNITHIRDDAQQTTFFMNAVVEPSTSYTYDAIYRLLEAKGREHAGQVADKQRDHVEVARFDIPHANSPGCMRHYKESYSYDAVGNITQMKHHWDSNGWTRHYRYATDSNRLLEASRPADDPAGPYTEKYSYDTHGSMIAMPHLPEIIYDSADQMREVDLLGGGRAFYVYDAAGQRVRKVHEHNGAMVEERIYLGGFEIYRKHVGGSLRDERETLHIMDGERRIAMVETKTIEGGSALVIRKPLFRFQFDNHLGSSSLELDVNAAVITYEEYHPYGTTSYHAMRSGVEVSLKRYRYTGMERDEESGLACHGARHYANWLGRWCSVDPEGLLDGANLYQYGRSNTINYRDKSGTQSRSSLTQEEKCTEYNPEGLGPDALLPRDMKENMRQIQKNVAEQEKYDSQIVIDANGRVGTRSYIKRQQVRDQIARGATNQGAGAPVGFVVYGLIGLTNSLGLTEVSQEEALMWSDLSGKTAELGLVGLAGVKSRSTVHNYQPFAVGTKMQSVRRVSDSHALNLSKKDLGELRTMKGRVKSGPFKDTAYPDPAIYLKMKDGFYLAEKLVRKSVEAAFGKYPKNVDYVERSSGRSATVNIPESSGIGWTSTYNSGFVRGILESGGDIKLLSEVFDGVYKLEVEQILNTLFWSQGGER